MTPEERQVTAGPGRRILTNINVWSPDGQWLVYDTRSDTLGDVFDGTHIEMVHVDTGEVRCLYESTREAHCGVATFHPKEMHVVFILGPEDPTPDWTYSPSHRQGVMVDAARPGVATNLDACDLTPPFTPGALRGGSHVHVFSPDGQWVSFTYDDALLPDPSQRSVGVGGPFGPVRVRKDHTRSHDGAFFSALITRTTAQPSPGSDEIRRACEDGWIGTSGYERPDGTRQARSLAFQGEVLAADGTPMAEVFLVDVPDDPRVPAADGPLEGTDSTRPLPPHGTRQRRLTFTESRAYPGLQGPRHWLRSSPDGAQIAFVMRDDYGAAQLWAISPNGGQPRPITRDLWGVASAFSWSPDGSHIAYAADNSVFVVEATTGRSRRLTPRSQEDADAPSPLACVFSPDGRRIAFLRRLADEPEADGPRSNQICVVTVP